MDPSATPRDRKSRRRGRKRRALALTLVLVAVAALVGRLYLDAWASAYLVRKLAVATGGVVELGDLDVKLVPLRFQVRDLELRVSEGLPHGPLTVILPAGRVDLGWSGLLAASRGEIDLDGVRLERLTVETSDASFQGSGGAAAQPLALSVGRLVVREGSWLHHDLEVPLELSVDRLRLDGGWNDDGSVLGKLSAGVALELSPAPRQHVEVESGFRLRGDRLDLFESRVHAEGLLAELSGTWRPGLEESLDASGHIEVDLDWVAPHARGIEPLAGRLEGPVRARIDADGLVVEGDLEGRGIRVDRFDVPVIKASARYREGNLALSSFDARGYGGRVVGAVDFSLGPEPAFFADVALEKLGSGKIFSLLGLPLPLDCRVDGAATLGGPLDDVQEWSGSGSFTALRADGDGVPVGGTGSFELSDGRVELDAAQVRAGSAELEVSLVASVEDDGRPGVLVVEGESWDASATHRATLRILEGLGVEIPEILERPLEGLGAVSTRVEFGGGDRFSLGLGLREGRWGDHPFDRASLDLLIADGRIAFERVDVRHEEQRVHGRAVLDGPHLAPQDVELELAGVKLDEVWGWAGLEAPDITGCIDGLLSFRREGGAFTGTGRVLLTGGAVYGERFDEIRGDLELAGEKLWIRDIEVVGPGRWLRAEAHWSLDRSMLGVELIDGRLDLTELDLLRRSKAPFAGTVALDGRLRVDGEGVRGDIALHGSDFSAVGYSPGTVSGVLLFAADGVSWEILPAAEDGWRLDGLMAWDDALTSSAELVLDDTVIDPWAGREGAPWGRLSGTVRAAGPLADPDRLTADAVLNLVTIAVGPRRLRADEPVHVSYAEGKLAIDPVRYLGDEFDFVFGASYGADDEVEAQCRGKVDFGLVSAIFPDLRANGSLDASVHVGGTLANPDWSGEIQTRDARVRWLEWGQTLDDFSGKVVFDASHARVTELRGLMGGGELLGQGELNLAGEGPLLELDLTGTALAAEWPEGFHAAYDTQVRVTLDDAETRIAGDVRVVQGLYDADLLSGGGLIGAAGREYTPAVLAEDSLPVVLDLNVTADGGVWARNDLLEVESRWSLSVQGTIDQPELTGRVGLLEGGTLRFRRQDYRVLSGSLDFFDVDRIDPYITFLAETTVEDYEVRLRVEGRMDQLNYELTSTPTLNQQDIIALLSTGRSPETSGAGDDSTEFTGDVAANYFAGALTGLFERQLESKLGLERFQIDPMLVEGEADPTTRITVGKRVSDDFLVVVSSDLGSSDRQIYKVEWRAARDLRLNAVRDTSEGIGGDVIYTRRYWWKKSDAEAAAAESEARAPQAAADGSVFGVLSIVGVSAPEEELLAADLQPVEGAPYSRSRMFSGAQKIRSRLARDGRIDADVAVETQRTEGDPPRVHVVYRVDPGKRSEVVFEGIEKDKLRRRLRDSLNELWSRALYTEDRYSDAVRLVLVELRKGGFYAADVQLEVEENGDGLILRFLVDTGRPVLVSSVELEGVSELPEERVRRQILTRPGSAFGRKRVDPDLLKEDEAAMRALYRDQGYLDVVVQPARVRLSADGSSARITFEVEEGKRFTLDEVHVTGDLVFPEEELLAWAGTEPGGVYSPASMLLAESRLRAGLDERGFPDARIRGAVAVGDDQHVDVDFVIEAGSPKTVGAIRIRGNSVTQEKVIRRQLELREGDAISREKVLRSQHQIYRLGLFRSVDISYAPLPGEHTTYRLDVNVEEARPLSMSYGLGYDTESKVRASFSTTHENVGGMNRTLSIQTYASSIRRRVQLVGKEPRLFDSRLPALATLFWEEREEVGFTVESRSVALRVARELHPRWNGYVRYNFKRDDLSDVTDEIAVEEEKLEDIKLGNLGLGILRSTRDDPILPQSGTLLSIAPELFDDWLLSDASFGRVTLGWNRIDTYTNRLSWASSVRLGVAYPFSDTERVPISERFFTGGSSTLRGFPRDEAGPLTDDGTPSGGQGLVVINSELGFPVWGKLRGLVFYDTGNVWEEANQIAIDDMRHVLGTGIRLTTPLGPLRLEYGHKLDRNPGESAGELFLAIGRTF